MNWEAIGAVGEVLGAIGVIATLGYLAIQIRHNSKLIWSQNVHAQTQQMQEAMALQANPNLVAAIERAYVTQAELSPRDQILLEAYLVSSLATLRDDFLHYQEGLMTVDDWERRKLGFSTYFGAELVRERWADLGANWEPELRKEIDALITNMN